MNEAPVTIRPMKPEDIEAVLELDRKITSMERAFTYMHLIDGFIGGQLGCSFVAESEGRIVGFVLAAVNYVPEYAGEVCLIQTIGVEPARRRRGIATELIRSLMDCARSRGVGRVRVLVDRHDAPLQALFESLDFERGRLIDYSRVL